MSQKKDSLGEKARTNLAVHRKLGVVSHGRVQKRKNLILLCKVMTELENHSHIHHEKEMFTFSFVTINSSVLSHN